MSVSFASKTRNFVYDSLNRMTEATNQQSKVTRSYDDLGRLTQEGQSIRLDGDVAAGFKHLVGANYTSFDLDSQLLSMNMSGNGGAEDLKVDTTYDSLHRKDEISARYFSTNYSHDIADYDYFGPGRLVKKTYGNDAFLTVGYDDKRRIDSYVTKNAETTPEILVGFEYAYDDVNNPLYTKWLHDDDKYDNYNYDELYRLTDVIYRDSSSKDYTSYGGSWASGNYSNYVYDDVSNRISATDADPFGNVTATSDSYTANDANEYTQVNRDSTNQNPSHDAAHNMTAIPVRPGSGTEAGNNVSATAVYDTFGQMANIQAGSNDKHYYIYDALGRRIVAMQLVNPAGSPIEIEVGRRYLYDGSMVASEYIFKPDTGEIDEVTSGYTTLTNGYSELERIYVNGPSIDEPLFCAIDTDQDSTLTIDNDPECEWAGGMESRACDVAFYYFTDQMGSIAALSAKNDDQTILEYYRYRGYGEAVVMPIKDLNSNWVDDTPTDLSDNIAKSISTYGNTYTFTSRRLDDATGLMYYRARFYSATTGRFAAGDPLGYFDSLNLFEYGHSNPVMFSDPTGQFAFLIPAGLTAAEWVAVAIFGATATAIIANPPSTIPWPRLPTNPSPFNRKPGRKPTPKPQPKPVPRPLPKPVKVDEPEAEKKPCEKWKTYCRYLSGGGSLFSGKATDFWIPNCSYSPGEAQQMLALPPSNSATCVVKYRCCIDDGEPTSRTVPISDYWTKQIHEGGGYGFQEYLDPNAVPERRDGVTRRTGGGLEVKLTQLMIRTKCEKVGEFSNTEAVGPPQFPSKWMPPIRTPSKCSKQ